MGMEKIQYDDFVSILFDGEVYNLADLYKPAKTRTIYENTHLFARRIKTEDIKISPQTYWRVSGHYDHQFEGHDAICYLCGWHGIDYNVCKCKESFTIEEHAENLKIARKNYLLDIIKNYFPEYVDAVSKLSYEEIEEMLYVYPNKKVGVARPLNFYFPSPFSLHTENWQESKKRMLVVLNKYINL